MELKSQIMADIKSAMKNKESDRLGTLRFLNAAIKNREIELRPNAITNDDVLGVIKKMVKQRKESIDQYRSAERNDLADKESLELGFLEDYLPEQMGREQVEALVVAAISELNASSVRDMGKVMKEVIAKSAGSADNKVISEIVKSKLQ